MKHLRLSLDLATPDAFTAFERLPQLLKGLTFEVVYEPVLLTTHSASQLALLRLLVASAPSGMTPSRWAWEVVLRHVWRSGTLTVKPQRDAEGIQITQQLEAATASAVARGVTAVPSLEVDGQVFDGLCGLDLLSQHLQANPAS